ncbi:MAG: M4 family metallopeptidase [Algicola sp.]|nr:M4 family metallopeptidase [Algicola sp.]
MTLVSSVDMGVQNAYWTGTQVIYGQAGGAVDNDFTSSFDIIAHEFTHGVIDHSAKLVYQSESGALNEAWSDIFGVTIKARVANRSSSNWLLGDGLFNTPYKAVRYMNDPTKDGTSKDYYPERYTGTSDNSGVHRNSGIANLAYVLMVQGGTHPRDKTTVTVPSIGMDKAEKIFYRALTTYMTQNTDFAGARTATASAADDLYGATVKEAVETAWCAVGVGYCPGPVIDPPNNELRNWVTETGLSASKGKDLIYTMQMPKHVTNIKFDMSGGTGDADMYVKFGSAPTDNSYDCRPYKSGNVETCNPTSKDGTYYVRVKAYSSFSGVSLTGSYTSIVIDPIPGVDETIQNIAVSQGQWQRYTQVLYNGATDLKVTISGGNGDADLYVRHGAQSTISIYDCRPWKNGNLETCTFPSPDTGIWYLDVYGYSSASGVTMRVTANY